MKTTLQSGEQFTEFTNRTLHKPIWYPHDHRSHHGRQIVNPNNSRCFMQKAIPDIIRKFNTQGNVHMTRWADHLEQKIKARWEAAAQAAINIQVDDSQCGGNSVSNGEGVHLISK